MKLQDLSDSLLQFQIFWPKYSIMCAKSWQCKRGFGSQSGVLIMDISNRGEEVGENRWKKLLVKFIHRN